MTDFGIDIFCVQDLDPAFSLVSGQQVVGQAVARRLITPRGFLTDAPDYGSDLRAYLGAPMTSQVLSKCKTDVEREATKDERVTAADAVVTFDSKSSTMKVALSLATADGPFQLELGITSVTIAILQTG